MKLNNKEFKIGDIVEVKNAFFKNQNGLYLVITELENICTLRRLTKAGKLSQRKDTTEFLPLTSYSPNRMTRAQAIAWNDENAIVEVRFDVDRTAATKYLEKELEELEASLRYFRSTYDQRMIDYCKDQIAKYQEALNPTNTINEKAS